MKRFCLFVLPSILLLALAPLPVLADEGDAGRSSEKETLGFDTASAFFGAFLAFGGNYFWAVIAALNPDGIYFEFFEEVVPTDEDEYVAPTDPWAEEVQRHFVEKAVAERARRNAQRAAQDAKRAKNGSDEVLPGLDPD